MTSFTTALGTGSSHPVFYVRPDRGSDTETAVRKFLADRRVVAGTATPPHPSDILVGLTLDDESRVLIVDDSGDVSPGKKYTPFVLEMAQKLRCFVTLEGSFDPYAAWREITAWRQSAQPQETIQKITNRRQTAVEFATSAGWVIAATDEGTDFDQLWDDSTTGGANAASDQFPVVSLFRSPTHRIISWRASPEAQELVIRHLPGLNPVVLELPAPAESSPVTLLTEQIRHLGYHQGVNPNKLLPAPLAAQVLETVNVCEDEFFATVLALLDGPVFAAHAIEAELSAAASATGNDVAARWIPLPGAVRVQPEPRKPWYKRFTPRWK